MEAGPLCYSPNSSSKMKKWSPLSQNDHRLYTSQFLLIRFWTRQKLQLTNKRYPVVSQPHFFAVPYLFNTVIIKSIIECDKIQTLPVITFVIGGQDYSLRGEDYVNQLYFVGDGWCMTAFVSSDVSGKCILLIRLIFKNWYSSIGNRGDFICIPGC